MAERVRRVVSGRVVAPSDTPPLERADVRVQVLDVTLADAPARVAAEQVIEQVAYPGGEGELATFSLPVELDDRRRFIVAAQVERTEDALGSARLRTVESYPVTIRAEAAGVDVVVRRA